MFDWKQPRNASLQDLENKQTLHKKRIITLLFLCLIIVFLMILRAVDLQLLRFDQFQLYSDSNRLEIVALPPVRGDIYDRNGTLVAGNRQIYELQTIPKIIRKMDYTAVIKRLAKIIPLSEEKQQEFINSIRSNRHKPVLLQHELSEKEVAQIASQLHNLDGLVLKPIFERQYPYKSVASHLIGYTDDVTLDDFDRYGKKSLQGIGRVGRAGAEFYFDQQMRGKAGYATMEQNAYGVNIRTVNRAEPIKGQSLHLSIDIKLQQYVESLLTPFKASVVLLDTRTGEVLTLASMPNYDLNVVANQKSSQSFKTLLKNKNKPFINRAINGSYPPGSTFKPFVALAALENRTINPNKQFFAGPFYIPPGKSTHKYYDWKRNGHGWVDLNRSIAQSCDVYFYDMAYRTGIDSMHKYISQFYFGTPTGINLPNESSGLLPSREWKKTHKHVHWFPGETIIFGIGQGYLLATPLQLAANTATLANKSEIIVPTILNENSLNTSNLQPKNRKKIPSNNLNNWNIVNTAMNNVVAASYGSAHRISRGAEYKIAGKTGTAQVIALSQDPDKREQQIKDIPDHLQDHSLFVGFAPYENPRVAIAVVIENGGSGSRLAAPLARDILDKYFELYPQL